MDKIQKKGVTRQEKTKKLYHALYSRHLLNIAVLPFSQRGGHLRTKMFADIKFEMATTKKQFLRASCIHMCVLTMPDSKHLLHRPFMTPPVTEGAVPYNNNSKAAQPQGQSLLLR